MNLDIVHRICLFLPHQDLIRWSRTCVNLNDWLSKVPFHQRCVIKPYRTYHNDNDCNLNKLILIELNTKSDRFQSHFAIRFINLVIKQVAALFVIYKTSLCERLKIDIIDDHHSYDPHCHFSKIPFQHVSLNHLVTLSLKLRPNQFVGILRAPHLIELSLTFYLLSTDIVHYKVDDAFEWHCQYEKSNYCLQITLPQRLKILKLYCSASVIQHLHLPHLKLLKVKHVKNCNLSLFSSLKYLHVRHNYFDQTTWPLSLKRFVVHHWHSHRVSPIPLTHLKIHKTSIEQSIHLQDFVHLEQLHIVLCFSKNIVFPPYLTHLIIPQYSIENHDLPCLIHLEAHQYIGKLPNALQFLRVNYLKFDGVLSSILRILHLHHHEERIMMWPNTLEYIYLPKYMHRIDFTLLTQLKTCVVNAGSILT